MKQWLVAVLLTGFFTGANAWEYQVVVEGTIVYQEPSPPTGIAYPPPGQRADALMTGAQLDGQVISEAELRQNLNRPHLVIIPDQVLQPRQAPR